MLLNGGEPAKWLAREVQSWGEFGYEDLEAAILDGRLNDLIDWQERYAEAINETLAPAWLAAIAAASKKASRGKIILSDTEDWVKAWLTNHGAELATQLSDESKKAIANVLLRWQGELLQPKKMAQQIRPLIGLNERQAIANANYRAKLYRRLISDGVNPVLAEQRADKAAVRYASKQHRYRAETIVNTELAFAYNQGAHEGVRRSIKAGYLNHCEMVWTTAGTNRVCGRCMELKDTVVGRTDETGVTLPPLHPRCRCAIMYREVGEAPRQTGALSGALNDKNDPEGKRRETHAELFYAEWRNSKKKHIVRRLAKNSGMSEKAISKIFDHVFITEHFLQGEWKRFDTSYYMAESFRRLSEGKEIQPHDLILLKHEWLELGLMKRYNYDYDTAHRITERKYNYAVALRAWRKEHE